MTTPSKLSLMLSSCMTWPQAGLTSRLAGPPADRVHARQGVLIGLGGVGKTQLAAGLAHRLWGQQEVDLLVWATATSRSGVVARYAQAAADIAGEYDPDPEEAAIRFLGWLADTGRRWLLVLDDLTQF